MSKVSIQISVFHVSLCAVCEILCVIVCMVLMGQHIYTHSVRPLPVNQPCSRQCSTLVFVFITAKRQIVYNWNKPAAFIPINENGLKRSMWMPTSMCIRRFLGRQSKEADVKGYWTQVSWLLLNFYTLFQTDPRMLHWTFTLKRFRVEYSREFKYESNPKISCFWLFSLQIEEFHWSLLNWDWDTIHRNVGAIH